VRRERCVLRDLPKGIEGVGRGGCGSRKGEKRNEYEARLITKFRIISSTFQDQGMGGRKEG